MSNKKTLVFCIASVAILALLLAANPFSSFLEKSSRERKILSSLYFTYPGITEYGFQLIKFSMSSTIYLEIYKIFPDNRFELMKQFDTKTSHDGHFILGSNATNLAIVDIDNDETNEIIVPGFDNNLVAHLNVYKYDFNSGTFEKITGQPNLNF